MSFASRFLNIVAFVCACSSLGAAEPAEIARQLLDDAVPAERRAKLIAEHAALAPELLTAMTDGLKPGPEEYRRIPWIWRVSIAAGKRNDAEQLRKLLVVSLPKDGKPLRDWQAVVIGGGLINGLSLENHRPGPRFAELLKDQEALAKRWQAALAAAHAMADDAKVPTGTRYDALRMIALDTWENSGERLQGYLKKGTNAELQMGAISALADIDRPEVARLLQAGLDHFPPGNRKLAEEALKRMAARK